MSVSKWRYTEDCDGRPCPGDCDHCSFEPLGTLRSLYVEFLEALDNIATDYKRLQNGNLEIWPAVKEGDSARAAYLARELEHATKMLKMDTFDMKLAVDNIIKKADQEAKKK